jgi:phosphatidylserine decarboxylase
VDKIYYIDRRTGEKKEEKVYFEGALRFLYGSRLGKLLTEPLARLPIFSKLWGWCQRLASTRKKITPFILQYDVDPTEFEKPVEEYGSFDAFFTRKLKNGVRPLAAGAVIPADGRYLFYQNIESCEGFVVKGKKFSLEQLLKSSSLAKQYARGSMAIARLCPSDYHRFHFPVDCTPAIPMLINGPLYSVNPIAVKQNVELLSENKRIITHLYTEHYGTILFIEIGATNVGSIHQTYVPNQPYKKGEEKGYFSFGGSSIIFLFEAERVQFANDLIINSVQHIETLCLFGQPLEEKYSLQI